MPQFLTFGQVAKRLGLVAPRVLSDAFYANILSDEHCQFIGERRVIPESYLERIAAALRRAGRLK